MGVISRLRLAKLLCLQSTFVAGPKPNVADRRQNSAVISANNPITINIIDGGKGPIDQLIANMGFWLLWGHKQPKKGPLVSHSLLLAF